MMGCGGAAPRDTGLPPVARTRAADTPQRVTPPPAGKADVGWVAIPRGTFKMGRVSAGVEEWPPHKVTIKAFFMSRAEVTVAQYGACVKAGKCREPHWDDGDCYVEIAGNWARGVAPVNLRNPRQPVACVTWQQARTFCRWAGGRLPTEAEWEYAARGGDARKFPWGDQQASCARAVMGHERKCAREDPCGCGKHRTWLVCSKPKGHSKHGLCDMAGNVWEWVEDCNHKTYRGAPSDGSAWTKSCRDQRGRLMRGGAWSNPAIYMRASGRHDDYADDCNYALGIRCARDGLKQ